MIERRILKILQRAGPYAYAPQISKMYNKNIDTVHNAPCIEERSTFLQKKHTPIFHFFLQKNTPPFHFLPTGLER